MSEKKTSNDLRRSYFDIFDPSFAKEDSDHNAFTSRETELLFLHNLSQILFLDFLLSMFKRVFASKLQHLVKKPFCIITWFIESIGKALIFSFPKQQCLFLYY